MQRLKSRIALVPNALSVEFLLKGKICVVVSSRPNVDDHAVAFRKAVGLHGGYACWRATKVEAPQFHDQDQRVCKLKQFAHLADVGRDGCCTEELTPVGIAGQTKISPYPYPFRKHKPEPISVPFAGKRSGQKRWKGLSRRASSSGCITVPSKNGSISVPNGTLMAPGTAAIAA